MSRIEASTYLLCGQPLRRRSKSEPVGLSRPDAVMYCLSAIEKFEKMSEEEGKRIGFEITMKGRSGLDTNDPTPKYQIKFLGTFWKSSLRALRTGV